MRTAKILTVVNRLGIGGVERVAQNNAVGYRKAGFDSAVVTLDGSGPRENALRDRGVDVPAVSIESAITFALRWKPDVVHIHMPPAYRGFLEAIQPIGAKIIVTNHFSKPYDTNIASLVDVDLHLSNWCLCKWRAWSRSPTRPVGMIFPNTTETGAFQRAAPLEIAKQRARWGVPEGVQVFGRIGQPSIGKWSLELLPAFAAYKEKRSDAILVLIGAPYELRKQAESMCLLSEIRFLEPIKSDVELSLAYSSFDVFVHDAAQGESFGMVLVESLLCGTPVLTKARPFRDNTQAEIVKLSGGGAVAWSQAEFCELLMKNEKWCALVNTSEVRTYLYENFSLDAMVPRQRKLVEAVLRSREPDLRKELLVAGFVVDDCALDFIHLTRSLDHKLTINERILVAVIHTPLIYRVIRLVYPYWHTIFHRFAL